jgi:hypothetical protein
MWLEGLGQLKKNPMTSSGIEPATYNDSTNYATACPRSMLAEEFGLRICYVSHFLRSLISSLLLDTNGAVFA